MQIAYSPDEALRHLQALPEERLTTEILVPLLAAMGFEGIRVEHGVGERGKDLLFWRRDPFGGKEWYGCQVKGATLTGKAGGRDSLRTVTNQLQQVVDTPFCDTDGNQLFVAKCFLITSSVLNPMARESVMGLLTNRASIPTRIIDGPELVALIRANKPSLLLPWQENLSEYCRRLAQTFQFHLDYKALGLHTPPSLDHLYVDVNVLLTHSSVFVQPYDPTLDYRVIFDAEQRPLAIRIQDRLKSSLGLHCPVTLLDAEAEFKIATTSPTDRATSPPPAARRRASLDYRELASQLWDRIDLLLKRNLSGVRIDSHLDDDDFAAITGTLAWLRVLSAHFSKFDLLLSDIAKPGFHELKLSNSADPGFLLRKSSRAWLLGHAGTGKSTLCRYHAFTFARSLEISDPTSLIPIVIPLCSYNDSLGSLLQVATSAMEASGLDVASMPLDALLSEGRFLLLLDGYDEVPSGPTGQRHLVTHIADFQAAYPSSHIVITSRYINLPTDLSDYSQYQTTLFSDEQIVTFCGRWFSEDRDKAERLRRVVTSNETFRVLCSNPLYLTLVAALMANNRPIPERKVEIYEGRLSLLLEQWDIARGVSRNRFEPSLKMIVLKKLAWMLHSRGRRAFHYDDFANTAIKWLPERFRGTDVLREMFRELVENNALLRMVGADQYDFGHLSFQEHLVGAELVEARDFDTLSQRVVQEWWHDSCLFACGILRSADEVISRLFDLHQEEMTRDDSILFVAAEIIAVADWTPEAIVRRVATELRDRYRRNRNVECVLMILAMRNRVAYRVALEVLRGEARLLEYDSLQNAIADVAGIAWYDELVSCFADLAAEVREFLIALMRRRATTLEEDYLRRLAPSLSRDIDG